MRRKQNLILVLLVSKKKILGNHTFFSNEKASIWPKTPYIALYFTAFLNCCLLSLKKCVVTPNFFYFNSPCLDLHFPHSHKLRKNTSVSGHLIGCDKKSEIVRYFQGRLCDKKGLLCGKLCKLCDFSLNYFKLVFPGFWESKPLLCCSSDDFFIKGQKNKQLRVNWDIKI